VTDLILAIDQGTTGTTCLVVGSDLVPLGRGYREVPQHFPRPGWVEHDPEELWESVLGAAGDALRAAGIGAGDLAALGIANQRETTVVWERASGRPVHRALAWQDRRTAERCRGLPAELLRDRTGLVPDPYFSATKLEWLLSDHDASGLAFGTVDSWLLWKLTGGELHATDVSNASRTLLFNLRELRWDPELLELFGVPDAVLPEVVPSSGVLGEAELLGARVAVAGLAGDQQAALFGQACFERGQAKVTYGTGSFVLVNVGTEAGSPRDGLVQTVAWRLDDRPAAYALEGSVFVTGAALQWLRDELGLLADVAESETLAKSVESSEGVYFVPALVGLGAPHWAPEARGLLTGIHRGTRREHVVRAALEATVYQVGDVLDAVDLDLGLLRADGGGSANGFLLQFQADVAGVPVEVPAERETTALGAAALAGVGVGIWSGLEELAATRRIAARYEPRLERAEVERLVTGWHAAVRRALPPG
jgi:glycerol kinase